MSKVWGPHMGVSDRHAFPSAQDRKQVGPDTAVTMTDSSAKRGQELDKCGGEREDDVDCMKLLVMRRRLRVLALDVACQALHLLAKLVARSSPHHVNASN